MEELPLNENVSLISKGLYKIVNDNVGAECIVKLRRQRYDIHQAIGNCDSFGERTDIPSGSRVEGFEMKSSDYDFMLFDRNSIVLTNASISPAYLQKYNSVFVMETDVVPPGFALLRCLQFSIFNIEVFKYLVSKGRTMYLSSKLTRENYMSGIEKSLHGPCLMVSFMGNEVDVAYTLKCPFWPVQAASFIHRALRWGWPHADVVEDICKDGCLFIPIYSKKQSCSDTIDLEWRISFSLAEKKLVYSMNHCQFLCYGLSKLFLNEIIKESPIDNDLLCSYFMKTAVFWEITENMNGWIPENFLSKFWNVFKRLMKWVSLGYCPNFFIPENNMFFGKICGQQQRDLLSILRNLYKEGFLCLLRCASLTVPFTETIQFSLMLIPQRHEVSVSPNVLESRKIKVICASSVIPEYNVITWLFRLLVKVSCLNMDSDEVSLHAVTLTVNNILQKTVEMIVSLPKLPQHSHGANKTKYFKDRAGKTILRKTKTYFCMNNILQAKCLYVSGNYHQTIDIVHYIKHKIQSQQFTYKWELDGRIIMAKRQEGIPYDTLINTSIMDHVQMRGWCSIEELWLELSASFVNADCGSIYIAPLVFLNFLLILSYTRLNEIYRRYDILCELEALVLFDKGVHVHRDCKAIAWEILGICKQLCGDREGAYQSYTKALKDEFNLFKTATIFRINSLFQS